MTIVRGSAFHPHQGTRGITPTDHNLYWSLLNLPHWRLSSPLRPKPLVHLSPMLINWKNQDDRSLEQWLALSHSLLVLVKGFKHLIYLSQIFPFRREILAYFVEAHPVGQPGRTGGVQLIDIQSYSCGHMHGCRRSCGKTCYQNTVAYLLLLIHIDAIAERGKQFVWK